MDYLNLSTILTFDTCDNQSCVNVAIVDDTVFEDDELFYISLARTSGLDDRITLDPILGSILIINIDGKYT